MGKFLQQGQQMALYAQVTPPQRWMIYFYDKKLLYQYLYYSIPIFFSLHYLEYNSNQIFTWFLTWQLYDLKTFYKVSWKHQHMNEGLLWIQMSFSCHMYVCFKSTNTTLLS